MHTRKLKIISPLLFCSSLHFSGFVFDFTFLPRSPNLPERILFVFEKELWLNSHKKVVRTVEEKTLFSMQSFHTNFAISGICREIHKCGEKCSVKESVGFSVFGDFFFKRGFRIFLRLEIVLGSKFLRARSF